jgi:hypothetical protein
MKRENAPQLRQFWAFFCTKAAKSWRVCLVAMLAGATLLLPSNQAAAKRKPASKSVKSRAIVAELHRRGGRCRTGLCEAVLTIRANGSVKYSDGATTAGTILSSKDTSALSKLIEATKDDPTTLPKFTGTCPTAYDGQERVFVLHRKAGVRTFAECSVQIPETGIFLELQRIWDDIVQFDD